MSKPVKSMIMSEYRKRYEGVESAAVVEMVGMDVHDQEKVRVALLEQDARMQVLKNSLARKAFESTPLEPLGEVLQGPCALVTTTQETLIETAKVLVSAAKDFEAFKLKSAVVEGDLFTVSQVAKMKGKAELLGEISGLIGSPGRALAGCLKSPGGKIAGCLKKMIEDKEAA
ncbi:MAG: 50S ribosomal protein L10 [Phycisphaerae bacterium]